MNGDPRMAAMAAAAGSDSADGLRSRNRRRDDAIRKKVEQELSRRTTKRQLPQHSSQQAAASRAEARRARAGTVASLRPATAIIIIESARIIQAAQLMAAKRTDAVLVVGDDGALAGILTDKDIAYRVVAEGLDVRTTLVSSVMTRNPIAVFDRGSRNEALNTMISRRFRHLPVVSDASSHPEDLGGADPDMSDKDDPAGQNDAGATKVVGLLDITKCVFDRLDDLERKVNEDRSIISAMDVLERRGAVASEHAGAVRLQHGVPDIGFVLSQNAAAAAGTAGIADHGDTGEVPEISLRASVRDAARAMKAFHSTAILISPSAAPGGGRSSASNPTGIPSMAAAQLNASSALLASGDEDRIAGIFTTKDIVLRVIAASLDPNTTSVVRVMTPHPDSVPADTSILDALKKLRAGHYLHLPVVDGNTPIGLVDVMTLTVAMLTYLLNNYNNPSTTANASDPAEDGPVWNKFWNSTFATAAAAAEAESDHLSQTSDSRMAQAAATQQQQHQMAFGVAQRQNMNASRQSLHLQNQSSGSLPLATDECVVSLASRSHGPGGVTDTPSTIAPSIMDDPAVFAFKLRDMTRSNKVFRFTSRIDSLYDLYTHVANKTGAQSVLVDAMSSGVVTAVSPAPADCPDWLDFVAVSGEVARLCFIDDEGDVVYLESDHDVEEAVSMTRRLGSSRLVVFLGEPSDAVVAAAVSNAAAPVGVSGAGIASEPATSSVTGGVMQQQPHPIASDLDTTRAATPDHVYYEHGQGPSTTTTVSDPVSKPVTKTSRASPTTGDVFHTVVDFFRDAPLPVNIAVSAGIVIVTSFILTKLRS